MKKLFTILLVLVLLSVSFFIGRASASNISIESIFNKVYNSTLQTLNVKGI